MNARARALLEQRDPRARDVVQSLVRRFPLYMEGWITSSAIAFRFGYLEAAIRDVNKVLETYPRDPAALLQKAQCMLTLGHREDARNLIDLAVKRGIGKAAIPHEAAFLHVQLGEFGRARELYAAAIALRPRDPYLYADRAGVARILGDLNSAEVDLDLAIQLAPRETEWYLNRTQLRRQTVDSNHVDPIRALLKDPHLAWRGRVHLLYALGKELDDLGDENGALGSFMAGAALRRAHLSYEVSEDVAVMTRIEAVFTAEPFARVRGTGGPSPIFVLGMPRSGTTLVERILGSIPGVQPAGELDAFAPALLRTVASEGQPAPRTGGKLALVDRSLHVDTSRLGMEYLKRVQPSTGGQLHFIDKTPTNILYCGLIARALPGAVIVHVSRHPVANCFGMFKTLFAQGYPFSYTYRELAQYFGAYRRLMEHWRRVIPGRLVEVSYESLVHNPEEVTRALAAACGLEWTDRCLSFHELVAPATSHSAAQVRQPLYSTAVDHWRRFNLQPLIEQLLAAGIAPSELA